MPSRLLATLLSPPAVIAALLVFAVVCAAIGISMLAGLAWTLIFVALAAVAVAVLLARGMSRG